MALTTDDVWNEWRRLTRFVECSKIAFQRELAIWTGLGVQDLSAVRIVTQNGPSRFSVSASEHVETLQDEDLLYFIVLTHSYSLCEAFARIRLGLAEHERLTGGIESWGTSLLGRSNSSWSDVLGGRAGLVEVAVVRSFIAHGSREVSQPVINRFAAVGAPCPWKLGDFIALDYPRVEGYRSRLKSLMRLGNA